MNSIGIMVSTDNVALNAQVRALRAALGGSVEPLKTGLNVIPTKFLCV